MRIALVLITAFSLATTALGDDKPTPASLKADAKALQGTWQLQAEKGAKAATLQFMDDRAEVSQDGRSINVPFKLSAEKDERRIQFGVSDTATMVPYKLDGDKLTISDGEVRSPDIRIGVAGEWKRVAPKP